MRPRAQRRPEGARHPGAAAAAAPHQRGRGARGDQGLQGRRRLLRDQHWQHVPARRPASARGAVHARRVHRAAAAERRGRERQGGGRAWAQQHRGHAGATSPLATPPLPGTQRWPLSPRISRPLPRISWPTAGRSADERRAGAASLAGARWRTCCSRWTLRSPSATRARPTSPRTCAAPTSSSRRWGAPRWSRCPPPSRRASGLGTHASRSRPRSRAYCSRAAPHTTRRAARTRRATGSSRVRWSSTWASTRSPTPPRPRATSSVATSTSRRRSRCLPRRPRGSGGGEWAAYSMPVL